METHAYSPLYLGKVSRTLGNMLHYAVLVFGMDGSEFLQCFVQSGIAEEIEAGNPKYIAGKSGLELFLDVLDKTSQEHPDAPTVENYERSNVYWVGWMLAHYQWYSGRSFQSILHTVPYEDLLSLYGTLHEADIQKSYEVLDAHFALRESSLKTTRKLCGYTQQELSDASGVPLNTIRAYERKSKDINKAQFDTILRLANALKCDVLDLRD